MNRIFFCNELKTIKIKPFSQLFPILLIIFFFTFYVKW